MRRVVIAGGGIAGLSVAWALRQRDPTAEVVLLERHARTGGNIRTERIDGYLCESGPDGFLDNAPDTVRLVRELGLGPRLQPSRDAASRRFIVRGGRLHEVPTSPLSLLTTPLLSARGKARIVLEPFARRRPVGDESIHDFAARRIGREAAAILVGSMVSGILAGNAQALSLRACFPRMWQMEDEHGGLIRAQIATARRRRGGGGIGAPPGRLTSFTGGMTDLIDALTTSLGGTVRASSPVLQLRRFQMAGLPRPGAAQARYVVATAGGPIEADAVVLAGPALESACLVRGFDPELAALLEGIPTAPLAVVCLGYDAATLERSCRLDGFGFLVAPGEQSRILGTLWETSIYPGRGPGGKALLRVMIGGARDPEAVMLDDERLLAIVRRDLDRIMGVRVQPEFVRIIRHVRGIPQYVLGHLSRMRQIDTLLEKHPGLCLAGNSYRGVSINACVAEANQIADAALGRASVAA